MEFRVPVALATVAYRFYVATHEHMIESLLEEVDGIGDRYHEVRLEVTNQTPDKLSVFYTLDVDVEDRIEVSFCMEFSPEFQREWVIFRESTQVLTSPATMYTNLKELCEFTFRLCKCGREAGYEGKTDITKDKCLECFMYSSKRTDNDVCPVCLEDEGVWYKLNCGHILHKHCFWKVQKVSTRCIRHALEPCPVCRQKITRLETYHYELKL
jgi:hypothetical protein